MTSALARINSAVCKFTVAINKESRIPNNIRSYITKDIIKNSVNSSSYILENLTAATIYRIMLWVGGDVSYDNNYWIHLPIRTNKETTLNALIELVETAESEPKEYEYIEEQKIPEVEDIEEPDIPTKDVHELITNTIPKEHPTLGYIELNSEDEKKEEEQIVTVTTTTNQITVDTAPHLPNPPYEYNRKHHRRKNK